MTTKTMKVIATARGFDGLELREPGQVFDVPATMPDRSDPSGMAPHSAKWFRPYRDGEEAGPPEDDDDALDDDSID